MKKKKKLLAIVGLLLIAVIGSTFAYYASNTTFENVFNAGKYKVSLTEEFVSPDNWIPGETIPKIVTAKNDGTVPAAVRISYTEQWTKENDGVETDITSQVSPNPAIINFANTGDWTSSNGYYYYKYILEPTDETSSFISGVTLDPNLDSVTCTGEGNEQTCESINAATGAKYILTFTIETAQADSYEDIWNTNVEITSVPNILIFPTGKTKDNLTVGDDICIDGSIIEGECFDFIRYDENDNLVMLARYNLNVGNNSKGEQTFLQDPDVRGRNNTDKLYGMVGFTASEYFLENGGLKAKYGTAWNDNNIYDNTYVTAPRYIGNHSCDTTHCYLTEGYSIAYYVEGYRTILESRGLPLEDVRLLLYQEAINYNVGCDGTTNRCSTDGFITNTAFWLGTVRNSGGGIWAINTAGYMNSWKYNTAGDTNGVRPVIVISKDSI